MKIYLGADHGGYQLKEELKAFLTEKGHEILDLGAHALDPQDDYPDFVIPTAREVASAAAGEAVGIVIGRSGNGEAIAANKVKGIRAALCLSQEMAKKAREHNDANILSLGGDFVDSETAKRIVETFLDTPFSNEERHERRIKKITEYESAHSG